MLVLPLATALSVAASGIKEERKCLRFIF